MISKRYLLFLLLFVVACGECSDPVGESNIFEPLEFGEYEFDGRPDLAAPDRLLFGDLEVGRTGVQSAIIENRGNEILKFSDWSISRGFEMRFLGIDGELTELRVGERAELIVTHTSFSNDRFEGSLVIRSNDPDSPTWNIELFVNTRFPCLEVLPNDILDFGEVEIENFSRRPIIVRNCSQRAITTFSVDPVRGNQTFSVPDHLEFQNIDLNPQESIQIFVDFRPSEAGSFAAEVDFRSNDEFEPLKKIVLRGTAAPGRCPEAVIVASHSDRNTVIADPNGTFSGLPLDTVRFNVDGSRAFDGREIVRYSWSISARPIDSSAQLSELDAKSNALFLDLAGEYTVELEVWDSDGIRSCQPARMQIRAISDEDIHIQLVWDTPNDPNQLDVNGSDIDLHLLNPRGSWNERPYDCFWQNLNPDWGTRRPGNSDFCATPNSSGCHDDPSLDIDDVDGWGPENINMNNPTAMKYGVGVHYFSDHGYGVSRATVRIFINGLLEREFLRQSMSDEEFWYVGDVDWPSGIITARGGIFSGFP